MKINYKSSFVAIILTFILFVGFGFANGSKNTAYANTKSSAWVHGIPKQFVGKSFYNHKTPLKDNQGDNYVYFGTKYVYYGYMIHGYQKDDKGKLFRTSSGNCLLDSFMYKKVGKNYEFKNTGKEMPKGAAIIKTYGTKKISFRYGTHGDKYNLTVNKVSVPSFFKYIGNKDAYKHP